MCPLEVPIPWCRVRWRQTILKQTKNGQQTNSGKNTKYIKERNNEQQTNCQSPGAGSSGKKQSIKIRTNKQCSQINNKKTKKKMYIKTNKDGKCVQNSTDWDTTVWSSGTVKK